MPPRDGRSGGLTSRDSHGGPLPPGGTRPCPAMRFARCAAFLRLNARLHACQAMSALHSDCPRGSREMAKD